MRRATRSTRPTVCGGAVAGAKCFGPASLPYPEAYRPRPGSRRFVQHLGAWYAQAHPTEDFAETFAVWLKPRSTWRREYRDWPAFAKLTYIGELAQEIGLAKPEVRDRSTIERWRRMRAPCANTTKASANATLVRAAPERTSCFSWRSCRCRRSRGAACRHGAARAALAAAQIDRAGRHLQRLPGAPGSRLISRAAMRSICM